VVKFIRRLLGLLFKFGFYTKHYKLVYSGEVISWNKLYSQSHWSYRSGLKNKYQKIFATLLLEAKVQVMQEMAIVVFYNNRMDVDNISLTSKWLADTIKDKYLQDDSNKYYKGLMIFHDPDLPKGLLELHITGK
jgi:hypothetical protein